MSVSVDSIISEMKNKEYTVELKDLENNVYDYSIFPMAITLKITNNADHIVTLDRTIVRLEDENQVEYQMIDSTSQNKMNLIKRVTKMYDEYAKNLGAMYCPKTYLDQISGSYTSEYNLMIREINEEIKEKNSYNGGDFLSDILKGLFGAGSQKKMVSMADYRGTTEKYSPHRLQSLCDKRENDIKIKVAMLKQEAVKNISEDVPDSMKGVLTGGVYPRIDILPGRTAKVIVPFTKRKEGEVIKQIYVGVFDLPTKVDAAANPTKREQFNFVMVAEKQ